MEILIFTWQSYYSISNKEYKLLSIMPDVSQAIIFLVEDNRTNYIMYMNNIRFYSRTFIFK